MNYIESNAHILACAYDSLGREEMRRFLYHDFTSIIETLIDNVEKIRSLCKKEFKYFCMQSLYRVVSWKFNRMV